MGRWRPPREKRSAYITPQGAEAMQAELKELWKVERPVVTATVSAAAKNGDRSENGDYIYGKMRLRQIDARVRFLSKRLDEVTVVDRLPAERDKVFFGAWVTIEADLDESTSRYRIVGPDEFDATKDWISMDSPLAKALLGKKLDAEVTVVKPESNELYYIIAIDYEEV